MDYQALKTVITQAPYVGLPVDQIVKLLNAPSDTMYKARVVTGRTILAECSSGASILEKLEAAASDISVKWALKFLGQDGLDAGSAKTLGMIDQLAAVAVLTAGEAEQLKSLSLASVSPAEKLGFGFVHDSDVRDALRT